MALRPEMNEQKPQEPERIPLAYARPGSYDTEGRKVEKPVIKFSSGFVLFCFGAVISVYAIVLLLVSLYESEFGPLIAVFCLVVFIPAALCLFVGVVQMVVSARTLSGVRRRTRWERLWEWLHRT